MIYLIPLIFTLYLVYHYDYRGHTKYKVLCYVILLVLLICIAGFRYRLGGDSIMYENYFEWAPKIGELRASDFTKNRFAPGYVAMQSLIRTFTSDFMWLQLFHATIVCSIIFWFFYVNTKKPFIAVLLFYFMLYVFFLMEVMRESLAVCMFLISWPMLRDGKWLKYYLCSVLALCFHISSLFMLFLPLLLLPGIRNLFVFGKRQLIILPLVLIFGLAINAMFYKYIELISVSDTITERAQVYSKHESLGGAVLNPLGAMTFFVRYLLYGFLAIYFLNKRHGINASNIWKQEHSEMDYEKKELSRLEFLFIVGSYFLTMAIPIFIFNRFNNYFFPFTIILISRWVFTNLKIYGRTIRMNIAYWGVLFLPMVYFQMVGYYNKANTNNDLRVYMKYYPYASRFDRTVDNKREAVFNYIKTL